ncbi:MAG: hypothetical protein QXH30_01660 [Candidatus Bilamarchaeaceae archaeon]
MSGKDAVLAILSVIIAIGLGWFWHYMRPADGWEIVAGVSIIMIPIVYLCLRSMGKS